MRDIETYNVIGAGNEQKTALRVYGQSLQVSAADLPRGNNLVGAQINRHCRSFICDVGVEPTAAIINGVPFSWTVELDLCFEFGMASIRHVEDLDRLAGSGGDPQLARRCHIDDSVRTSVHFGRGSRNGHAIAAAECL